MSFKPGDIVIHKLSRQELLVVHDDAPEPRAFIRTRYYNDITGEYGIYYFYPVELETKEGKK